MPLDPPAIRPGIGRKGRLALIGGAGLIVIIGIYLYHQHKRRQGDAAASTDALAFEDPTVPMPDSYAPAMLSPITSGGAGGYADPGGTIHTYTMQDIMDLMKATELPTGGGGLPPLPTVNFNPAVAEPAPAPAVPVPSVVPSAPSPRRVTRTCDQYYNKNGNCWHRTTVYYSDGTWKITHNARDHRGKCDKPRSTC